MPSLFEAKTVNGEGEPHFSAVFLLEPDHPQLKDIRAALKLVAKEKWAAKADAIYTQLEKQLKLCLHDRDRSSLIQADGRPYAGCYVTSR